MSTTLPPFLTKRNFSIESTYFQLKEHYQINSNKKHNRKKYLQYLQMSYQLITLLEGAPDLVSASARWDLVGTQDIDAISPRESISLRIAA